jgi:hypothetical protein
MKKTSQADIDAILEKAEADIRKKEADFFKKEQKKAKVRKP